jgi:hypothetical protein
MKIIFEFYQASKVQLSTGAGKDYRDASRYSGLNRNHRAADRAVGQAG